MAQINVSNLTFGYEGSYDTIFENVSFSIDTSWKLGFVGRNGKGKTTFLQLLLGKYEYQGAITRSVVFDYFPYPVKQKDLERTAAELMEDWKAGVESWRVLCELEKVDMDAELLYRPFGTLSFGERTRVMLAVLFSGENEQGDRVFLKGKNGCGKSSLIKYILTQNLQNSSNGGIEKRKITMSGCENLSGENIMATGTCSIASNLVISYINQDTSHLSGTLKEFAKKQEIDEPMLLSMLRSLDLDREQFVKNMEEFSEGQKKKVLIAASLLTPAHLYLWDEPLNYIDVFSRMQIEKLIAQFQPTMLIVEHDARFARKLATKVVEL